MAEVVGRCFCGSVEVRVTGDPVVMGYCHCSSCRSWSAGPVNAFTLWAPDAVTVTQGEEHVSSFAKTERSHRKWCNSCGGHVLTDHPTFKLVDVYAATIPELKFVPSVHLNYGESVLRVTDALPKFADLPADMGGSGQMMDE